MSVTSRDGVVSLARSVRALADATVDREIDEADARHAEGLVAQAIAALTGLGRRQRDVASMAAALAVDDGEPVLHFEHCHVCGPRNGGGLGIVAYWRDDAVVAEATLRPAHEGAPGIAHGGVVSLLFDDVLSYPAAARAGFVVTTDLMVKYVAPTPVGLPLSLVARCTADLGDRFVVSGTLFAGERATAVGTAWFRTGDRRLLAQHGGA